MSNSLDKRLKFTTTKEFIEFIDKFEAFRVKSHKYEFLKEFIVDINNNKTHRKRVALNILFSTYWELVKDTIPLKLIKGLQGDPNSKYTYFEGISYIISYSDNHFLLKNALTSLSPEALKILKFFCFGNVFKDIKERSVLSILTHYYPLKDIKKVLEKELNTIPKIADLKYFDFNPINQLKTMKDLKINFPLYVFTYKNKEVNLDEFNYYYIKRVNNQKYLTNDTSNYLKKELVKNFKEYTFLFVYKKVKIDRTTKIIPLIYTNNLIDITKFENGDYTLSNNYKLGKQIKLLFTKFIEYPKIFKIKSMVDLKNRYKLFFKSHIAFSKNLVGNIRLKQKTKLYKVVDFLMDTSLEIIGVKYERFGRVRDFKTDVSLEMLETGISNLWVEGYSYYWGDEELTNQPIRLKQGLITKCIFCGEATKTFTKRMCIPCYKKLVNFIKFTNKENFSIKRINYVDKDEHYSFQLEKYNVSFYKNRIRFEKDLEHLKNKPYQILLPFSDLAPSL